jgi:hypothetical protein
MENAQALAATAKLGSEPERAQILLFKVYTPCRVAPEPTKAKSGKKHHAPPFGPRQPWLRCTWQSAVSACIGGANITNVGDRKETGSAGTSHWPRVGSRLACTAESPPGAPPAHREPTGRVPILDLSREYRAIGPLLLKAVEAVFSSQNFIMGAQVAEFERAAAEKCGVAHAIGCSSGTDALWLALEGAGIGPGDAVITTCFSFFATVSAILRAGAQPLLADIDPETFNLDPAAAKHAWSRPLGPPFGRFCRFTSMARPPTGTASRF